MKQIHTSRIIFSLSLIVVWSLCFLDIAFANKLTVGIGFVYTFLSPWAYKKITNDIISFKSSASLLVLLGPIIHVISVCIFSTFSPKFLIHPVFYAFICLLIAIRIDFGKNAIPKLFFAASFSLLYAITLFTLYRP